MVRQIIKKLLGLEAEINYCADSHFGDYATNWALKQAKKDGQNPLVLATDLAQKIGAADDGKMFAKVKAMKPGFVNFTLSADFLRQQINEILAAGESYGSSDLGRGQKISIDFVSANPTGPVHVGNARGGPLGDTLANVLQKAGFGVERVYYLNDDGNQIDVLGHSILGDQEAQYSGEYIESIRKNLDPDFRQDDSRSVGEAGVKIILEEIIKPSMEKFGIEFDNWLSEKELKQSGAVDTVLNLFKEKKLVYEKDGAWWFRASEFGDEADRVVIKSTGEKTYFGADIAGHKARLDNGADKLIDIWGADHHGAIKRLQGALAALGYENKLKIILTQFVRVLKSGQEMKMSKRAGTYVSIDDLIDEVGKDATRFFFLQRSPDTHMDFDLDLAKEQSEKNPVYYVQYAHARICAILRKSDPNLRIHPNIPNEKEGYSPSEVEGLQSLNHSSEFSLIKQLIRLPEIVEDTAQDYQVHRLSQYALDLVRQFHKFYEDCRVIDETNPDLTQSRLALVEATRVVLKNALDLMGIRAPEKM